MQKVANEILRYNLDFPAIQKNYCIVHNGEKNRGVTLPLPFPYANAW